MIPFVHNAGGDKASTPAAQSTGKGTEHELLALDPSARALHWRLPWVRPHVRSIPFAPSKCKTKHSSDFYRMSRVDRISGRIVVVTGEERSRSSASSASFLVLKAEECSRSCKKYSLDAIFVGAV